MKQSQRFSKSVTLPRMTTIAIACHAAFFSLPGLAQVAESSEPTSSNRVSITGKAVGMGLMVEEAAPKARSTVSAEELDKQRPTGNAYAALELMPAVNSYNYDATGLFGGGLTLRGFNSDQIGATINGVPVNDSGNFAVYPQEFVDQENTCSQYVTQGSTDVDSPQVGATGGNFGITTCDPTKEKRIRVMQTVGQLSLSKTFLRYDSGLFNDQKSRFFISGSHAQTDKWKGEGQAKRDHIDIGFRTDFDRYNTISGTLLYNRAINNNFASYSLADLNKYGYNYDYSTSFIGHVAPTKGKADVEVNQAFADSYYKLSQNPFENVIASVTGKFRVAEKTFIKVIPYYWYGYGTGSKQQQRVSETAFLNTATGKTGAGVDLNGDGDTLDQVIVANSSVTLTHRPGLTASVSHTIDNHQILAGFWYERASHKQYGPMVAVDAFGNAADIWLEEGRILRPDGTPYQSRDWETISTGSQYFVQDTVSLMEDRLSINVGLRMPTLKRDFTNIAHEAAPVGYQISRSYSESLPQLGASYYLNQGNQLFASLAKNMKAPANFVFSNLKIVNGLPVLPVDVKAETSSNLDVGYRYQSKAMTAQLTWYDVDFRDRQATAYDPVSNTSSLTNVGKVKTQGFELELGSKPVNGWSYYGSAGYANSEIKDNLKVSSTVTLPLAGKKMALTPEWKYSLSAQYETDAWYARLKAKYTGTQQATLMNDEEVPAYTLIGLDAGYQFSNSTWYKKPTLRMSISNLLNEEYRNPASQTVTNAQAVGAYAARTNLFYYMGAPRMVSLTMSVDF